MPTTKDHALPSPLHLFIDFDGTISEEDTTDLLLQRFADPEWEAVEAAWARGEMGSRECMARQVSLLRMTPEQLDGFLDGVRIDPAFPEAVALFRRHGVPVTVLSDGLDLVARGVLDRAGVDAPVLSNRLRWQGGDRWKLDFPHARTDCASAAGNCKCTRVITDTRPPAGAPGTVSVLIGDGRSDFCAARAADVVFAKGKLAAHCRERRIPHLAFQEFGDLTPLLRRLLERTVPITAVAGEVDAHPSLH